MKLQQRSTIIVVIVFALLLVLVYLVEIRGGEEAPGVGEGRVPVFSFAVEDAVLLEVTDSDADETVTVRRSVGEAWRMVEPFEAEADDTRIGGLLGRLSRLESTRVIQGADIDLQAFGLSEPSLEVEVGLQNGENQVLLVGQENPAGYSQYVQREGEDVVYLVGSSTIHDLENLIGEPPEKPTPMPAETLVPTVITARPTVSGAGTPTVTPTLTLRPTSTAEE